ncbi:MAG TPA: hypothetical protein P5232_00925 [Candidatus Moranbacteria bacterium]|nr:hypothetical protein [Candidatus Moranbacteria bacterium]
MSRVLTIKKTEFGFFTSNFRRGKTKSISPNCSVFSMRECSRTKRTYAKNFRGSFDFNFKSTIFVLASLVLMLGIFYLYQVNDLATKGYEIKEMEKQIANLSQINKNNRIKEVELKSMYNIEKTAEGLNLVSSKGITYLNLNGPVAMK